MILNEFFESNSGKGTNENKPEPTAGSWQDIWKQNPDIKNPKQAVPEDVTETSDYFRRREREEAIISGQKPARKKQPTQTSDYARRREQEKKAEKGVAEAATDDPRFQKMMGNIQQSTPNPVNGYVAVSYASERPSKKIKGVTYNGKPMPSTVDPEEFMGSKIKFTPDQIEEKLMKIGQKYGWDSIDPGHGQGYDELYFDTRTEYTSATQRQLAVNIVKTVDEINKFFTGMNSSLQATGLPGYKVSVWQGMGENGNINQYEDLSHITNIAKGQTAKPDAGPAIGKMILKHLPSYEAENDELGYDPQDFQAARNIANIYITKGERAGLQAQGDSEVSEMIDELLSDAGASGLRTIWDLDEQGVAEAFGPLPRDNQQIRLGRHTVNIERVGEDKDFIGFAWHDSKGQDHYEEVSVGDLGSYDDLIDRIKQEISYQERQYTDQGVAESKDDKIAQLKKDHDTAVHWSKNETSPQKREAARQKAEKIKRHLETQYKQGVAEVSDVTKQSYKAKAQAQVRELEPHAKKGEYKDIAQRAIDRRTKGLARVKHSDSAQQSMSETAMKDKAIEFQDYKTMAPGAFYSRYGMTRDQWLASNRTLFSRPKSSEQVRDRELAKMRAIVAARADVQATQSLASRVSEGMGISTPEGRPALGQANMTIVVRDYHQNLPFATMSFGNSGNLKIDRKQMRVIMDYYLSLKSPEEKHDFVYETMSRLLKVIALFDRYKVDVRPQIELAAGQKSDIPGVQPQLFELDASQVKDTRLSRALKQARAEFPTAGSDIEAFLKLVMSNDDRDLKTISSLQTVNQQQNKILDRVQDIDQKQNQEIDGLDAELDRVTQINKELERKLDQMGRGKPSKTTDKAEPAPAAEPVTAAPKAQPRVDLPVGSQVPVKKAPAKAQAKPAPAPKAPETPALPNYSVSFKGLARPQGDVQQALDFTDNNNVIQFPRQPFKSPSLFDPNEPVTDVVPKDYDRLRAEFFPNEPERQQRFGEGTKTKNIGQKDFDSFSEEDWDQWDSKVKRLGQRVQQGQTKPAKASEPKAQPSTDKKSNMTEARLHRRAVLRQILES